MAQRQLLRDQVAASEETNDLLRSQLELEHQKLQIELQKEQAVLTEQERLAQLPKCPECQQPLEGNRVKPRRCAICREKIFWLDGNNQPIGAIECRRMLEKAPAVTENLERCVGELKKMAQSSAEHPIMPSKMFTQNIQKKNKLSTAYSKIEEDFSDKQSAVFKKVETKLVPLHEELTSLINAQKPRNFEWARLLSCATGIFLIIMGAVFVLSAPGVGAFFLIPGIICMLGFAWLTRLNNTNTPLVRKNTARYEALVAQIERIDSKKSEKLNALIEEKNKALKFFRQKYAKQIQQVKNSLQFFDNYFNSHEKVMELKRLALELESEDSNMIQSLTESLEQSNSLGISKFEEILNQ